MRILLPLLVFGIAAPAAAADRNFTVTDFDRIRIDGPFSVTLTTGSSPFAKARAASASALDHVSLEVQGRTLVIHPDRSSSGRSTADREQPVEIAVGTHGLTSAWINGAGSIAIDHVKGLTFDLAVEGPGSASIALAEVDDLRVRFAGTATGQVRGKAAKLTAQVRGASALDATGLAVKDAVLAAEGPASLKAQVTGAAKVDAYGAASVELGGRPACTSRIYGSASVSGCK